MTLINIECSIVRQPIDVDKLWIAFVLYLWNIECSSTKVFKQGKCVVNCFRFVSLKYWMQLLKVHLLQLTRCELLSFCIFEILNAVIKLRWPYRRRLWIAFVLYLWNIECSRETFVRVNIGCCELLSFCIFEILNAVEKYENVIISVLWIAFVLYLWNIECSHLLHNNRTYIVVNCFRFVSLKYWMQ